MENQSHEILRSGERRFIEWTKRARQDWTFYGFEYQAYDALIAALSNPDLTGNIVDMEGAEMSYEFFFQFEDHHLYGKLGLRADQVRIKIFSTHRPYKEKL